ncbi:M23 family metallopeptidase [Microcoleus sp. FACHB-1515]|nr:M23 family metallopeptidase [Microcoleus sp. FACHB-1515]
MVKAIEPAVNEQPAIERPAIEQPIRLPEAPSSTATPTATARAGETIAISTDPNATRPQQIAQINPSQIAANQWAGSSFPVESFQAYTSPFGYRRSATGGYGREFHYGLDLAAPMGSYIRNWWAGTVVEVSDNSNCGTSVVVESGHWLHIYCHMQGHVETVNGQLTMLDRSGGVQIAQGQQVAAGTRIGRVGMTGRTTGPHLHWGLKYDGNWVNPALVLRAMYAGQQATAANPQ